MSKSLAFVFLLGLVALVATSCVSVPQPARPRTAVKTPQTGAPRLGEAPIPPSPSAEIESVPSEVSPPPQVKAPAPPAVLALLEEADAGRESGDFDGAATALERAIRIQPRNALLWHRLAEVRLRQQQPILAEDLARKSLVLGDADPDLIRRNWALIAEARRLRKDEAGALEAAGRARQ